MSVQPVWGMSCLIFEPSFVFVFTALSNGLSPPNWYPPMQNCGVVDGLDGTFLLLPKEFSYPHSKFFLGAYVEVLSTLSIESALQPTVTVAPKILTPNQPRFRCPPRERLRFS